jgi:hypothetical protein
MIAVGALVIIPVAALSCPIERPVGVSRCGKTRLKINRVRNKSGVSEPTTDRNPNTPLLSLDMGR